MNYEYEIATNIKIVLDPLLYNNKNILFLCNKEDFLDLTKNETIFKNNNSSNELIFPTVNSYSIVIPSCFLYGKKIPNHPNALIVDVENSKNLKHWIEPYNIFVDWVPADHTFTKVVWRIIVENNIILPVQFDENLEKLPKIVRKVYLLSKTGPMWQYISRWLSEDDNVFNILQSNNMDTKQQDYTATIMHNLNSYTQFVNFIISLTNNNCVILSKLNLLLYYIPYLMQAAQQIKSKVYIICSENIIEQLEYIEASTVDLLSNHYLAQNSNCAPKIFYTQVINEQKLYISTDKKYITNLYNSFGGILVIINNIDQLSTKISKYRTESQQNSISSGINTNINSKIKKYSGINPFIASCPQIEIEDDDIVKMIVDNNITSGIYISETNSFCNHYFYQCFSNNIYMTLNVQHNWPIITFSDKQILYWNKEPFYIDYEVVQHYKEKQTFTNLLKNIQGSFIQCSLHSSYQPASKIKYCITDQINNKIKENFAKLNTTNNNIQNNDMEPKYVLKQLNDSDYTIVEDKAVYKVKWGTDGGISQTLYDILTKINYTNNTAN